MKVLYAIQATGNGHLARAIEIIPALMEKANVDVLISGIQSELTLPYPVSYRKHGLSFIFGKNGQVDILKTLHSLRPHRLWKDIRQCPVGKYDLVVHDFEPITAHACKRKGIPNVSLSHQASFHYAETPRPPRVNHYAEWIIRNYAPSDQHIGLHFASYHPAIYTPVIRKEIRLLCPENKNHTVVYLPAYSHEFLSGTLTKIPDMNWKIFSKHCLTPHRTKNVEVFPVDNFNWLDALRTCEAAMVGAGFEGPAEIMYLGKKLMAIPMKNQYEQQCNAAALKRMGIKTMDKINPGKVPEIKSWLMSTPAKMVNFPDNTSNIVSRILKVS